MGAEIRAPTPISWPGWEKDVLRVVSAQSGPMASFGWCMGDGGRSAGRHSTIVVPLRDQSAEEGRIPGRFSSVTSLIIVGCSCQEVLGTFPTSYRVAIPMCKEAGS